MGTPRVKIIHGDALDRLRRIPDASVAAVVTDPPYMLGFMGKAWDTRPAHEHLAWHTAWAVECLRVLKPGGHLLAFGGTRTWHRMACAIEDAGFELRDTITWLYGSGFPKSLDVGKAIDATILHGKSNSAGIRAAGESRPDAGPIQQPTRTHFSRAAAMAAGYKTEATRLYDGTERRTGPATPEAQQWHGWGTALKPASEPIVVARKPLAGTVAANVLAHGTGALNIDACRVESATPVQIGAGSPGFGVDRADGYVQGTGREYGTAGRWPANVVLDGDAADALDEQSGTLPGRGNVNATRRNPDRERVVLGAFAGQEDVPTNPAYNIDGGASRFFPVFRYQAKAPARERPSYTTEDGRKIAHPTVKPLELMRWLVRLVTPPGGTVVDPFAGSGTTGEAAWLEGFNSILIENDADSMPLIRQRMARLRGTA